MGVSSMVSFSVDTIAPAVSVLSPEDTTYAASDVALTFTVDEPASWMGYSLDGSASVTVTENTTLTSLSDGAHSVVVYASDIAGNIGSSDIAYFTVDASPPSISILSPENKTYDTTDIPLTFTVDESVAWMAYSLDGQTNVTTIEDTTLTGLSDGSHSLIVYGRDTAGNTGVSETIYFSITTEEGEPFPILIVAAIVIMALVVAGLLVYYRTIKKTAKKVKK